MSGQHLLRISLVTVLGIAGLWLAVTYCLPALLPFGVGALAAALARPMARRLERRLHLPRWAAGFLCVSAVFACLSLLAWLLVRTIFNQLGLLAKELPNITRAAESLEQWLLELSRKAPAALSPALSAYTASLFTQGSQLARKLSDAAFSMVGGIVAGLPDVVLFAVTAIASGFMLCAKHEEMRLWVSHILPLTWKVRLRKLWEQMKQVLGGWCRAQLLLLGLTFLLLSAGLWILGVPYALLLGGIIALIDALPVLGAGLILLPWGIVAMLQGKVRLGLGLAILYGIAALRRTTLEPRLLGKSLGMSPLLTLFSLYAGFRLCGVAGMLVFPIGALFLRQMIDILKPEKNEKECNNPKDML